MSCPDWRRLAAHRLASPAAAAEEPAGWGAALEHLEGCPDCRRAAVAHDPLLVFRRLPALDAGPDAVEAMRSGVAALRRARRVAPGIEPSRPSAEPAAAGLARWWGRAAAAAVLAGALLAVGPAAERPRGAERSAAAASRLWPGGPEWTAAAAVPAAFLEDPSLPAVDDIEHPTASVYHFDEEDVELVMVVDADLDV